MKYHLIILGMAVWWMAFPFKDETGTLVINKDDLRMIMAPASCLMTFDTPEERTAYLKDEWIQKQYDFESVPELDTLLAKNSFDLRYDPKYLFRHDHYYAAKGRWVYKKYKQYPLNLPVTYFFRTTSIQIFDSDSSVIINNE